MNKFYVIVIFLFLIGCEPNDSKPHPFKFRRGEKVSIIVNNKPAYVIGIYGKDNDPEYQIRYSDDRGELKLENVYEYEIKKLEVRP